MVVGSQIALSSVRCASVRRDGQPLERRQCCGPHFPTLSWQPQEFDERLRARTRCGWIAARPRHRSPHDPAGSQEEVLLHGVPFVLHRGIFCRMVWGQPFRCGWRRGLRPRRHRSVHAEGGPSGHVRSQADECEGKSKRESQSKGQGDTKGEAAGQAQRQTGRRLRRLGRHARRLRYGWGRRCGRLGHGLCHHRWCSCGGRGAR
mmetsp:Transcript_37757/g.108565  ORF Transcript_37757/g.108565 Transcript_37757/m.108565 type:complete len:204 (-) Transcript_37757:1093-1704(-)